TPLAANGAFQLRRQTVECFAIIRSTTEDRHVRKTLRRIPEGHDRTRRPSWARRFSKQEVTNMEESSTYQALISRGELKEARRILLQQGRRKLGEPDPNTLIALESISSRE